MGIFFANMLRSSSAILRWGGGGRCSPRRHWLQRGRVVTTVTAGQGTDRGNFEAGKLDRLLMNGFHSHLEAVCVRGAMARLMTISYVA